MLFWMGTVCRNDTMFFPYGISAFNHTKGWKLIAVGYTPWSSGPLRLGVSGWWFQPRYNNIWYKYLYDVYDVISYYIYIYMIIYIIYNYIYIHTITVFVHFVITYLYMPFEHVWTCQLCIAGGSVTDPWLRPVLLLSPRKHGGPSGQDIPGPRWLRAQTRWGMVHNSWVISHVPIFHITQPWSVYGLLDGYYFWWCPIFPSHGTFTNPCNWLARSNFCTVWDGQVVASWLSLFKSLFNMIQHTVRTKPYQALVWAGWPCPRYKNRTASMDFVATPPKRSLRYLDQRFSGHLFKGSCSRMKSWSLSMTAVNDSRNARDARLKMLRSLADLVAPGWLRS